MGYHLRAFIAKNKVLEAIKNQYSQSKIIDLNEGWAMIPLTDDLFDEINDLKPGKSLGSSIMLTDTIEQKLLSIIGDLPIAYIEMDYFGGIGNQSAVYWESGKREAFLEPKERNANEVLKFLGVKSKFSLDEFETLGLNKFRSINDWL